MNLNHVKSIKIEELTGSGFDIAIEKQLARISIPTGGPSRYTKALTGAVLTSILPLSNDHSRFETGPLHK